MRHRLVSIIIIQCLVVVVLMSRATADETADTREAVQRTQAEKDFVVDQMRLFLTSIVDVEEGLGSDDMDQIAREAAARVPAAKINETLADTMRKCRLPSNLSHSSGSAIVRG